MKRVGFISLVFPLVFLAACSGAQSKTLEQNRALWESQAIRHYRFDLEILCNCPWYDQMPLTIEVQDGEVVSMVAAGNGDISPYMDTFRRHDTFDKLFDTVDSAISGRVYRLEVQYDATYGFPTSIAIEVSRFMTDDATGYRVTEFEALP